jgi:hypothetical protein
VPVAFFHWQLPRQKNTSWWINPLDVYATDEWVPQQKYPVEIPPRASHPFLVSDVATFRQEFKEMIDKQSLFRRILHRFVHVSIVTDDGMRFRAKIDKGVRREIRELNPLCSRSTPRAPP